MTLGAVFIFGALLLFLYNFNEEREAERATANLLQKVISEVEENADKGVPKKEKPIGTPPEFLNPDDLKMTEVQIDGHAYIGYLSIPKIGIELPIMSGWDYARLRIAPCRYKGSVMGEDFVILAHNYAIHFGRISKLEEGDKVIFTDMNDISTVYKVVALDILPPTAVEEMVSGEFDLTLFTCTYGGKSRVTVYCNRVIQ